MLFGSTFEGIGMKFSMSVVSGVCFVLMCLNAALADSVAAQGRAEDADSSKIESMIAAACAPGGSRLGKPEDTLFERVM